ncbi:DUF3857 domain-containing protein [Hymenobacter sp. 15J16-1T3B]|uniref:DUF3857 domain-containing protein n=1 Tax=Hymenobacter sp. 15J16-1T3B TaxID=2886941 RepID=UPI001D104665|nr:DUF3857 domain-containing protein [Hymenobacter sp. 15J16-1T3B]MCC3157669.1 DUF3857 domain-containing protein [Hymenobacter sp. 15J16-1T3B]
MRSASTLQRPLLALLLAGIAWPALAQKNAKPELPGGLTYADYKWQDRHARLPVSAADASQPAVILRDFTAREYVFDARHRPLMYTVEHRIVRVNTDEGIEQYNKIYLPIDGDGQVVQLRARTVSPRGQVVEVAEKDMKELKDGEGSRRNFRIIAVDGVEKGSEVEYIYAHLSDADYFGREWLQNAVPAHDVDFELIAPPSITYEARTYHGPEAKIDTLSGSQKRRLRVQLADVPALRDEAFAHTSAQRMRVEFKIAYSAQRGRSRLFTWNDASQLVYGQVWELDKDEKKAVEKFDKQLGVSTSLPVEEQIRALEQGVKTSINVGPGVYRVGQVVATRTASELGMARLLAGLLRAHDITHEVVVVADRSEIPFDGDFDTWNQLDHYAFYFPATKQYLAPGRPDYRYGMIPAEWTASKALSVKLVQLGAAESAVGVLRDIPALPAELSPNDLDIKVDFAPTLDKATVAIRQVFGGYQAQPIQPYFPLMPADKRTEVLQTLVKSSVPDATFKSLEVKNAEAGRNALQHPLTIDATVESAAVLDRAGPKYLFKVGELIGPQSSLYQQEERQLDVENTYNHRFNRTIVFDIPAGYRIRNLTDLNIKADAGPADKPVYFFHSVFQQQGQKVTVQIEESYNQIYWPKKDFEAFRNVINASANFNKVVLVLEKGS